MLKKKDSENEGKVRKGTERMSNKKNENERNRGKEK